MKYTEETYDQLVTQSYCYHDDYPNDPHCILLKSLYEQNYLKTDGEQKIPKKIHQIWIGGELPEQYRRFTQTWMIKNPDWEYRLWTDKDAEEFGMEKYDMFRRCRNNGQKSDIFRYEILRRYGGLYIDTDFECLKSFDDLLYLDFFTSIGYERRVELYIGLIACVPNHPIINKIIKGLRAIPVDKGFNHIFNSTGSYHFTRKFFEQVKDDGSGVVAFPMGFFYPFPNNKRKFGNPDSYVKPYSYANHHWAVSWTKAKDR